MIEKLTLACHLPTGERLKFGLQLNRAEMMVAGVYDERRATAIQRLQLACSRRGATVDSFYSIIDDGKPVQLAAA